MSPSRHQSIRRSRPPRPINIPVMTMHPRSNSDIIDADFDDDDLSRLNSAAGKQLQDLFKKVAKDEYTPPPPNIVPAKPWSSKNVGWTNSPTSNSADSQATQSYLSNTPQFIHLEEEMLGNRIKGAFLLSRRSIIVILLMFTLMIIGAQCVPDVLEIIFSFI